MSAQQVTAPAAAAPSAPRHGSASRGGSSSPVRNVTVAWQAVPGAKGYEVLIRPFGGDVIVDRRTGATSIVAALRPGTYQLRVVTFNIFGKPASESPWGNLDVVRVFRPKVARIIPRVLYSGLASESLTIDGAHYLPETTVEIIKGRKNVAAPRIDKVMDDRLAMHIDLATVPPGKYGLKIVNPEGVTLVRPDALEVRRRVQPSLDSVSLAYGYNDRVYRDVTVTGQGFSNGTAFILQNARDRIDLPNVVVESPTSARVDMNLSNARPGAYSLVAANPGGLTARIARAVRVESITYPRFERMTPSTFTVGRSSGTFILTAKDMNRQTQVFLRRGATLVPTEALPAEGTSNAAARTGASPEVRRFRIGLSTISPGNYDLLIVNGQFLSTTVGNLVTVKPEPIPLLTSSSVTHAYDTASYPNVVLTGRHLLPRYRIAVKLGSVQHDLATRFVSSSKLEIDADFRGMPPGRYTVIAQDSGRTVATLPGGILVTPPPPPPPPLFAHPSSYTVLVGYPVRLVLSNRFAGNLASSVIGGNVAVAIPLGEKLFPRAPVIRDAGIEAQVGYSSYGSPSSGSSLSVRLGITGLGADLYYRTPFNFPLNGVFRAGYGISWSGYRVSGPLVKKSSGVSTDFYYRLGAGAQLDIGKRLTFEAGVDWNRMLYPIATLDTLGVVVRGGVRIGG